MKRGEWEQWKKFLGKDFRKEIRVKGARLAEEDVRKAIKANNITDEIKAQAKSVDSILNTNLSKKISNLAAREGAAKAATAIRTPIKRLAKGFEDRVKAINKTFAKKLSKLEPSQNDQINQILKLAKTGDEVTDTKAMTIALKNKFLDAVEDVADGQRNALSMQALRKIDKSLGSNYEKMAKDAGRAVGFNLDVLGKVKKAVNTEGGIPSVSISVAGALGGSTAGSAAVKAAGASQIARKVAISIKGKKAERGIKEIFKLKKAGAKRAEELRKALKDTRDGKNVLESELSKGNLIRNLDVLVSKGIIPLNAIKAMFSEEELKQFIEKNKGSEDKKTRNFIQRIERK
jgi:hypothetical protein